MTWWLAHDLIGRMDSTQSNLHMTLRWLVFDLNTYDVWLAYRQKTSIIEMPEKIKLSMYFFVQFATSYSWLAYNSWPMTWWLAHDFCFTQMTCRVSLLAILYQKAFSLKNQTIWDSSKLCNKNIRTEKSRKLHMSGVVQFTYNWGGPKQLYSICSMVLVKIGGAKT